MEQKGNHMEIGNDVITAEASIEEGCLVLLQTKMRFPTPSSAEEWNEMKKNFRSITDRGDGFVSAISVAPIEPKALKEIAKALKEGEDGEWFFEREE